MLVLLKVKWLEWGKSGLTAMTVGSRLLVDLYVTWGRKCFLSLVFFLTLELSYDLQFDAISYLKRDFPRLKLLKSTKLKRATT